MACRCLRPPYSHMEPGWNDGYPTTPLPLIADQWNEYVNFQVPQGVFVFEIPFTVAKASPNIVDHGLKIWNSADSVQVVPTFNIVSTTINGMTVIMDQQVDSDNYRIRGIVSVVA